MHSEHKQSAHMYRVSQYSGTAAVPLAVYDTFSSKWHINSEYTLQPKKKLNALILGIPVQIIFNENFLRM